MSQINVRREHIDKFTLIWKKGYTINLSYLVRRMFLSRPMADNIRVTSSTLEHVYDLLRVDRLVIAFFM